MTTGRTKPEILDRQVLYTGRKVDLEVHRVRGSDGRETRREVVRHRGAVAVVALPEPGKVLLEHIWRYAVDAFMFEIPAGTLEPGEERAACAARELQEETGYRPLRLDPLLTLHPSPGILTERIYLYVTDSLEPCQPSLEPGEEIECRLVPVPEALEMVRDGRITDAKTVAGLLYWDRFRRAGCREGGG